MSYKLLVTRPHTRTPFLKSEWLSGEVEGDDLSEICNNFLVDPRDTILRIWAWSMTRQQFAEVFRRTSNG